MILPRQWNDDVYCRNQYGTLVRCSTTWNSWARWVVLAVVVIAFLVLFFLCSCLSARRRRRAGRVPFYGTGWAVGKTAPGHGVPQYNNAQPYHNNNNQWTAPAPPYSPPHESGYYAPPPQGANQSYFNQQSGVELQNQPQAPPATYQRAGEDTYAPPPGPPPNKPGKEESGIIR